MHDVAKPKTLRGNVKPRRKSLWLAIAGIVLLLLALLGVKAGQIFKMTSTPMTMPPTTVSSATVQAVDWAPVLSSVGSISPVQGATIAAELGGTVGDILFENGGTAKKGDVLMRLDTSAETAQLHTAEADMALAKHRGGGNVALLGLLDGQPHRAFVGDVAERPMPVHHGRGRRFLDDDPGRAGHDVADLDAVDVGGDQDDAMRIMPDQVGADVIARDRRGFLG